LIEGAAPFVRKPGSIVVINAMVAIEGATLAHLCNRTTPTLRRIRSESAS
jgi:hypothetical protein